MFKEIQSGLSKFFGKRWIPILIILVVCFALISYAGTKSNVIDRMTTGMSDGSVSSSLASPSSPSVPSVVAQPLPSVGVPSGPETRPVANPNELLPADPNSGWGKMAPINQGNIALPDLLQAGYHIGLDTIGQTLKNPNLQLRSDPIIEKADVGPWNISTYEADYGRVPLELGFGLR